MFFHRATTTRFMELISGGLGELKDVEEGKWVCKVLGHFPGFGGTFLGMNFPPWRVFPFLWKSVLSRICSSRPSWGWVGDSSGLGWSRSPSSPWALPSLIPASCWAGLISRRQNRDGIPRKFPLPRGPFSSHILEFLSQGVSPTILGWPHPAVSVCPTANAPHPLIYEGDSVLSPHLGAEICMEYSE